VAALFGVPMRFRRVVTLTLLPLAMTAVVAASLAPVAWLFTTSLPPPSNRAARAHRCLRGDRLPAFRIRASWIAVHALVGGVVHAYGVHHTYEKKSFFGHLEDVVDWKPR
jgi:hypothetical protein